MGHYIDTYCKSAIGIGEIYNAASQKIRLGAIAVGESHDKPHGRAIVYDLIAECLVTRLFIELPHLDFAKQLRNDELGKPPDEWEQSDGLAMLNLGVGFRDREHGNQLPMLPLIQTAVHKKVKVYFYDLDHPKPASNEGMQARNQAMAKVFLKHTASTDTKVKSPTGAVALVGGKHLETPIDDTIYTLALQATCNIPSDHVFNVYRLR